MPGESVQLLHLTFSLVSSGSDRSIGDPSEWSEKRTVLGNRLGPLESWWLTMVPKVY